MPEETQTHPQDLTEKPSIGNNRDSISDTIMDTERTPAPPPPRPVSPDDEQQKPSTADADAELNEKNEVAAPDPGSQPVYSIFTTWEKRAVVFGAAIGAFFSPVSAQIYFPALNVLSEDLHVSTSQINLTVTTYMIFQGLTPMFVGSFADATGRRPAYLFCFVVYMGANIGCALAPNYAALLVLRMLQSAGASTTVALCQAVVADIITSAERGQYVGWTSVPIILAPSLGPVLGGLFSQYLGWRWIFWFLTIASGFVFALYVLFMPETCRNIVGDGSIRPHKVYRTVWQLLKDAFAARQRKKNKNKKRQTSGGGEEEADGDGNGNDDALGRTTSRVSSKKSLHMKRPNPMRSLAILFEREMFILLAYSALIFAGFYSIATILPEQLAANYGFDELQVGLMYLPMGGGSIVAAFAVGRAANWNYRRHCARLGVPFDRRRQQDLVDFPIERARLEPGIPTLALNTLAILAWGWALQYGAPVAVPCVLLFVIGFAMIGFSNMVSILIVDINPGHAGAATAANNLTRCLLGAAATAVVAPMVRGIGAGWSFTIIALLFVALSPAIWLIMARGPRWRRERRDRERRNEERREADDGGEAGGK
ncbi:major facilitator superfamily transporter [Xylariomycetidae sp. FL2044]|nr:major facilitator superfamily transporter [Xylariomycetidae sp. FL2044]